MSGRKGLVAVTVLTVFTTLLGGGALNAFAAEQGGRGHGGDERGAASRIQPVSPSLPIAVASPSATTTQQHKREPQQVPPGLSTAHSDEGLHVGQTREHEDEGLHKGDGWGNIVRQQRDAEEDLVTPPVRVTDTPRPCGDDDDHCRVEKPKHHEDDRDNAAEMEDSGDDD
jgi:hypothetical protein